MTNRLSVISYSYEYTHASTYSEEEYQAALKAVRELFGNSWREQLTGSLTTSSAPIEIKPDLELEARLRCDELLRPRFIFSHPDEERFKIMYVYPVP